MKQIINVVVNSESGCNIHNDEFTHSVIGMIGGICLDEIGGESDFYLISECVREWLSDNSGIIGSSIDDDVDIELVMRSVYEQQDNGFIKYFEVESHEVSIS